MRNQQQKIKYNAANKTIIRIILGHFVIRTNTNMANKSNNINTANKSAMIVAINLIIVVNIFNPPLLF